MADKVLANDAEEYDAKQPPTKTKGIEAQAAEWKTKIDGVDDERLLDYICSLASAKRSMISAEDRLSKPEVDDSDSDGM